MLIAFVAAAVAPTQADIRPRHIDRAVSKMRYDRLGADDAALRRLYSVWTDIQRLLATTAGREE